MANEKKVTMKDIAEELDVSIVTVSKALAGKEGVGDSLREKILRKSKELGYVIKRSTVSERGGSRSIAIIIAERFIGDTHINRITYSFIGSNRYRRAKQ